MPSIRLLDLADPFVQLFNQNCADKSGNAGQRTFQLIHSAGIFFGGVQCVAAHKVAGVGKVLQLIAKFFVGKVQQAGELLTGSAQEFIGQEFYGRPRW